MGRYQAYREYKDSGVEWLGNVPKHWAIVALKRTCQLKTGLTPPTENQSYYSDEESAFPWIRPEDIGATGEFTSATKYLSATGWKLMRSVPALSSLICCIGTIGKVGISNNECATNQQITSAIFSCAPKYNYYLICAASEILEVTSTGNVIRILNSERLGSIKYLAIPESEATKIANFLDHETAKIDTLIEKQQQQQQQQMQW